MRRLGIYASACAPAVVVVPMIIVSFWEYFNVRFPPRLWRETIGLRWLQFRSWVYPQFRIDEAQVLCLLVLVPTITVLAVVLYRRHRCCMESVGQALSGLCPADEPPRGDLDAQDQILAE